MDGWQAGDAESVHTLLKHGSQNDAKRRRVKTTLLYSTAAYIFTEPSCARPGVVMPKNDAFDRAYIHSLQLKQNKMITSTCYKSHFSTERKGKKIKCDTLRFSTKLATPNSNWNCWKSEIALTIIDFP
jgi:hypothetical protein